MNNKRQIEQEKNLFDNELTSPNLLDEESLDLTLGLPSSKRRQIVSLDVPSTILSLSQTQTPLNHLLGPSIATYDATSLSKTHNLASSSATLVGPRHSCPCRNSGKMISHEDKKYVEPPFPWASNQRAHVHNMNTLLANGMSKIKGIVKCRRCDVSYEIEYDLLDRFEKVRMFIQKNKGNMHDRAPKEWMNPRLDECQLCHNPDSVKPEMSQKKRSINWLFLLLGQTLGFCTLEQLKYFCKHTGNHRTGAKDRVLYLAYLSLCRQLDDANALFDR